MSAFGVGSDSKATLRKDWDLPIISAWAQGREEPLTYFGLPGPHIRDILEWRKYLGACTGVERFRKAPDERAEDLDVHRRLMTNIFNNDLSDEFTLLRGDIHDILLKGTDNDGAVPPLSHGESPAVARFAYDLVNLDFLGGMGYVNKMGGAKRVQAIKQLIERQQEKSFLFMLTLNVRDTIGQHLTGYLEGRLRGNENQTAKEALEWYARCGKGLKAHTLKAAVPLFVRREAESKGFDCYCYPPVAYEGDENARMVHFAYRLTHTKAMFHESSEQHEIDVLNLPLVEVNGGTFALSQTQHPNFDYAVCDKIFGFLASGVQDCIRVDMRRRQSVQNSA